MHDRWRVGAVVGLLLGLGACAGVEPQLVAEELPGALLSVRGAAVDDVWVCGADGGDGPEWLHWDGATWERLDTSAYAGVDLWWLAVHADTVEAVGSGGTILSFDRRSGAITSVGPDAGGTFFGVYGDEDGAWAVGGDPAATVAPLLWERTATGWGDALPAAGIGADGDVFFKVHGRGGSSWLVGNGGLAFENDGAGWAPAPTNVSGSLLTVDVGAEQTIAVGGAGSALILHRAGQEWVDRSPELQPGVNGVCSGGGETRAVGAMDTVHRWDGAAWTTPAPDELPTQLLLDHHSCWIAEDGTFWAVGGDLFRLSRGFLLREGEGTIPSPP